LHFYFLGGLNWSANDVASRFKKVFQDVGKQSPSCLQRIDVIVFKLDDLKTFQDILLANESNFRKLKSFREE